VDADDLVSWWEVGGLSRDNRNEDREAERGQSLQLLGKTKCLEHSSSSSSSPPPPSSLVVLD
jgi:hypothetical protein